MIISHSKKFVMLAPWKTASSTCHASLQPYNESAYDRFFHFSERLGRVIHQHLTLGDFMALPEAHLGYKIAAFVRNPYDRAYSGFIQIQRDFELQPRMDVSPNWISDLIRVQVADNMARIIAAGFDFDEWIKLLPAYEVLETGRNTNMPLHPAHYWTHIDGCKADFVGKVESFSNDFTKFCSFVGIEKPTIQIENTTENEQYAQLGYSRYAGKMSRRSLDRINDLFARDFDLFGYSQI